MDRPRNPFQRASRSFEEPGLRGADFAGKRLNTLYAESVSEDEIIKILTPIFSSFAKA